MIWLRAHSALLATALVAVTSASARADHGCPPPAPCAPVTCTVKCIEWVPEKYTVERTCYRTEYKKEEYTAYRCECVPVTKTRTCTYYEMVPEEKIVTRTCCKCVAVEEERTIMQTHVTCKPVVKTVRKCVDKGHWECCLVECKPTLWEKLRDRCRKDCCEPRCPKYKTKKVWVSCPVWIEEQVTCMVKHTECKPIKVKCTTYKMVPYEEKVKVTCCKCVAKQKTETYTCYETRKVPYTATRCVAVCVPYKETVTCCRLVAKCVEKQVPCEPCCCEPKCKSFKFTGLFGKKGCCN